jgi:hypothetical protein
MKKKYHNPSFEFELYWLFFLVFMYLLSTFSAFCLANLIFYYKAEFFADFYYYFPNCS